jgi:hypothetical protein
MCGLRQNKPVKVSLAPQILIFVVMFLKVLYNLLIKPVRHVLHSPYRHAEREGSRRGERKNCGLGAV